MPKPLLSVGGLAVQQQSLLREGIRISTQIPPRGMRLWWDASALNLSSGTDITSMTDFSGNGAHGTVVGSAPPFTTSQINGRPGAVFVRAQQDCIRYTDGSLTVNDARAWTILVVVKLSESGNGWEQVVNFGASAGGGWALNLTAQDVSYRNTGASSRAVPAVVAATLGATLLLVGRRDGTTLNFRRLSTLDPYVEATSTFLDEPTYGPPQSIQLARFESGFYFGNTFGELLFYNSALAEPQLLDTITYLRNKWLP